MTPSLVEEDQQISRECAQPSPTARSRHHELPDRIGRADFISGRSRRCSARSWRHDGDLTFARRVTLAADDMSRRAFTRAVGVRRNTVKAVLAAHAVQRPRRTWCCRRQRPRRRGPRRPTHSTPGSPSCPSAIRTSRRAGCSGTDPNRGRIPTGVGFRPWVSGFALDMIESGTDPNRGWFSALGRIPTGVGFRPWVSGFALDMIESGHIGVSCGRKQSQDRFTEVRRASAVREARGASEGVAFAHRAPTSGRRARRFGGCARAEPGRGRPRSRRSGPSAR